jgi:phosphoglycerate dehydrogenase-like enzyme
VRCVGPVGRGRGGAQGSDGGVANRPGSKADAPDAPAAAVAGGAAAAGRGGAPGEVAAVLRVTVLDDYQRVARRLADWQGLGPGVRTRFVHRPLVGEDDAARALADSDAVVAMRERTPFTAGLIARLPRLRLVVTTGMRNAAIDLAAARAHGVVVCGTDSRPEPTVELTWALILALMRRVGQEDLRRRRGGWQRTLGADLAGHRLGVVGLGRIGARVARVGAAFGMAVAAWSPHLTAERAAAAGVALAPSLDALMATSDVVSVHLALGETTRGLIGEAELGRMRPTAYLVNTARAAIVEPRALLRALTEGWIAGAALDVYEREPLPADDPLRRLGNVVLTPHLGYVTEDTYRLFYGQAVEDVAAFLAGRPLRVLT